MADDDEVFCTNCRAVIPRDVPYCPECGTEQSHVTQAESIEQVEGEHLPVDEEYCANCGEVISADVPYCPQCGADQTNTDSIENSVTDSKEESWLIGFKKGATGRNIVVGLLYFFFYPIGIPLLLYSYLTRKRKWSRRRTGMALGAVLLVLVVGLGVIGALYAPPSDASQSNNAPQSNENSGDATQEPSSGQEQSLDVAIRIQYSGEWSGAVSVLYDEETQTRSISGEGTRTISLEGDPEQVSVNAQKQDDGSRTLTVQIIEDGEVIAEASTSSEYGVAQTSADIDDFI